MIALITITSISCSKSDPDITPVGTTPVTGVNNGDLKLFVIDTAKVKTITMTGTNETSILNRKVNNNSYISRFSLNSDATKFVYVDNQGAVTNGGYVGASSIRTANSNGTSDVNIYTVPANTATASTSIGFVKYGASKIYFSTSTQSFVGGAVSTTIKMNSMNFDGTGLVDLPGIGVGNDVTSDGKFLVEKNTATTAPYASKILIYDRSGDNGAGSLYKLVNVPSTAALNIAAPVFSYDDKFAYYAYAENQSLKVEIINMATKTSEVKTIASGFSPTSFFMTISVGSDNNRGVLTVQTFGTTTPSKSYVFSLATSTSTVFSNNDENVSFLYAH